MAAMQATTTNGTNTLKQSREYLLELGEREGKALNIASEGLFFRPADKQQPAAARNFLPTHGCPRAV